MVRYAWSLPSWEHFQDDGHDTEAGAIEAAARYVASEGTEDTAVYVGEITTVQDWIERNAAWLAGHVFELLEEGLLDDIGIEDSAFMFTDASRESLGRQILAWFKDNEIGATVWGVEDYKTHELAASA